MTDLSPTLNIHRLASPVTVLGPHSRACIWVQGCPFRCPDCISPETISPYGGKQIPVTELVEWVILQKNIEGITISGGEPFEQADELSELIESVKAQLDLGVVCYTGYTIEELMNRDASSFNKLLRFVDLLIDGRYESELHANLLWRGSSNQRLLFLTDRYRSLVERIIIDKGDSACGLEILVDKDGAIVVTGVPHEAGFRQNLLSHIDVPFA